MYQSNPLEREYILCKHLGFAKAVFMAFVTFVNSEKRGQIKSIMVSSPPCWWTKTKDLLLARFVRPPAIIHCRTVVCL